MGIKDLWRILTPYCERKPLYELEGKVIAIDLAGWVCESLNTVDYFVHPKQYLKNLFYRTCYLLLEGIIPVFVLEGKTPELKYKIIASRNEIQFRGAKPKNNATNKKNNTEKVNQDSKDGKGRTRFNYVLKNCENLLECLGLECIQGPGEAEAFCAFLNKRGLVEGVVSQDSDCFAYGAIRVYRNFSVCSAGQGGSIEVYDMNVIRKAINLGQNKIIVMALLCGCDYCPDGINGIGHDSVIKLLKKYSDDEILEKIKSWRNSISNKYYTNLELRVDDKNVCTSCGHLGKVQSHTRNGCSSCRTHKGCDSSLWKEERLLIKSEIGIRQKALANPNFPAQEIIDEYLSEPKSIPNLNLKWKQPNLLKFIKTLSNQLQWTEIYCFQKMLPLITRWQIKNYVNQSDWQIFLLPISIKKKRVLKGIGCYEVIWKDEKGFFDNLIPDEQIQTFIDENPKGIEHLWSTIEPRDKFEKAYPELVEQFNAPKMKKQKTTVGSKRGRKPKNKNGLNDFSDLLKETEEINKSLRCKGRKKKSPLKGLQMITKFLIQNKENTPKKLDDFLNKCSTPKSKNFSFNETNLDNNNENDFNFSEIVKAIISKPAISSLNKFNGHDLFYEHVSYKHTSLNKSKDDMALISNKRELSINSLDRTTKHLRLYQSLENINFSWHKTDDNNDYDVISISTDEELNEDHLKDNCEQYKPNISHFFDHNTNNIDEFEKSLDFSFIKDFD